MKTPVTVTNPANSQRDVSFDVTKALCIIFVVYGHVASEGFFRDFVYLFHVGVFFFISGYFLHFKENTSFFSFAVKKLKGLYLPYLALSIPLWLANHLLYHWQWEAEYKTWGEIAKRILVCFTFQGSPFMALPGWFLKSLFFALCVTFLLAKCIRKVPLQYLIVVGLYLCGLGLAWINVSLPWKLEREMALCLMCFLGYRAQQRNSFLKLNLWIQQSWVRLLTPLVIGCLILLALAPFVHIDGYSSLFSYPGIFPLTACLGVLLCYFTSKVLVQSNILTVPLCFIGRHTLSVLLLHVLAFKTVSYLYLAFNGGDYSMLQYWTIPGHTVLWTLLYVIVGVGLPLLIVSLCPSKKRKQ